MYEPRGKRFKSRKFLKLAKKLINDKDYNESCRVRTCIGRAYYAAFLFAKNKLEQLGCKFPDDYQVHTAVIDALMDKDRKIGSKLEALKIIRCDSDYHMDVTISKGHGQHYVGISERIINDVELLR